MACGLAVVITQIGAEKFASHSARLKSLTRGMSRALPGGRRVIEDVEYRKRLATVGRDVSQWFQWQPAIERMERLLLAVPTDSRRPAVPATESTCA